MSGWIKIHRQILEWEWYSDNNTFRLLMHLILKANHKEKRYRGIELKVGSVITSRDILAIEIGLSVQQVRTSLDKLKSTNEITIKTSSQGTIIQVVNYQKYQVATSETTKEQPKNNQQVTTNKNEKNEKKEISIFIEPTFNEVLEYCTQRKNGIDVNKFINFYTSKGWMVGKNKMKDWKACIRSWEKPIEIPEVNEPKKWKPAWA
jgi:allophanate hydrolase subunit 1